MDGIFGIGPLELFLIAVIALIVLGPERLPHALREVAKTIRKVREVTSEFTNQFSDELQALDEINPRKILSDIVDPSKPLPGDPKPPAAKVATTTPANGTATTGNGAGATTKPAPATPATDKPAQAKANAFVASQKATEEARATKAAKEAKAKEEAEAAALAANASATSDRTDSVSAIDEDGSSTSASLEPSDGVLPVNTIMPPDLHTNGAPTEPAAPAVTAQSVTEVEATPQAITADESA